MNAWRAFCSWLVFSAVLQHSFSWVGSCPISSWCLISLVGWMAVTRERAAHVAPSGLMWRFVNVLWVQSHPASEAHSPIALAYTACACLPHAHHHIPCWHRSEGLTCKANNTNMHCSFEEFTCYFCCHTHSLCTALHSSTSADTSAPLLTTTLSTMQVGMADSTYIVPSQLPLVFCTISTYLLPTPVWDSLVCAHRLPVSALLICPLNVPSLPLVLVTLCVPYGRANDRLGGCMVAGAAVKSTAQDLPFIERIHLPNKPLMTLYIH